MICIFFKNSIHFFIKCKHLGLGQFMSSFLFLITNVLNQKKAMHPEWLRIHKHAVGMVPLWTNHLMTILTLFPIHPHCLDQETYSSLTLLSPHILNVKLWIFRKSTRRVYGISVSAETKAFDTSRQMALTQAF